MRDEVIFPAAPRPGGVVEDEVAGFGEGESVGGEKFEKAFGEALGVTFYGSEGIGQRPLVVIEGWVDEVWVSPVVAMVSVAVVVNRVAGFSCCFWG